MAVGHDDRPVSAGAVNEHPTRPYSGGSAGATLADEDAAEARMEAQARAQFSRHQTGDGIDVPVLVKIASLWGRLSDTFEPRDDTTGTSRHGRVAAANSRDAVVRQDAAAQQGLRSPGFEIGSVSEGWRGFCVATDKSNLFVGSLAKEASEFTLNWQSVATADLGSVGLTAMPTLREAMESGAKEGTASLTERGDEVRHLRVSGISSESLTLAPRSEAGDNLAPYPECTEWQFSGSTVSLAGHWVMPVPDRQSGGLFVPLSGVLTMKEAQQSILGNFVAEYSVPRLGLRRKVAFHFSRVISGWKGDFQWSDARGNEGVGGIGLLSANRIVVFWKKRNLTAGTLDLTSGISILYRMD